MSKIDELRIEDSDITLLETYFRDQDVRQVVFDIITSE